jgi:Na+-driven multidrug efflux pump
MINTWISLVTLGITLGLDLALIPLLDVSGAAIASTLAYMTNLALTLIAYRRLSGGSVFEAVMPRPSDVALFVEGARSAVTRLRRGDADGTTPPLRAGG